MKKFLALLVLLFPSLGFAAASGVPLEAANVDVSNQASLQRGARLFVNYCLSCHSVKFMRYSRMASDLGLTEEQVMANLNFTGAKFGESMVAAMTEGDGNAWFGKAPPDLSLTARSRGVDWIYTYLKSFYADESRPMGWNNTVLAGASMPHVLWELQGVQRAVMEKDPATGEAKVAKLELAQPGQMSPGEYDQAIRDLTTFMAYVGEPAALQREKYGVWVILFLALFTFVAWLLKREYWRDIH